MTVSCDAPVLVSVELSDNVAVPFVSVPIAAPTPVLFDETPSVIGPANPAGFDPTVTVAVTGLLPTNIVTGDAAVFPGFTATVNCMTFSVNLPLTDVVPLIAV